MTDTLLHEWLVVGGHWTKVISFGPLKPCVFSNTFDGDHVLLVIITGNFGVADFYSDLASHVVDALTKNGRCVSAWIVSHAGHAHLPEELYKYRSKDTLLLLDQIEHKRNFFDQYVPKHVPVFLVGHSIGCYIILQLLDYLKLEKFNVKESYLLFPTFERMGASPSGMEIQRAVNYKLLPYPLMLLASLIYFVLPICVQTFIIRNYSVRLSKCVQDGVLNLFGDSRALKNTLLLAADNLKVVLHRSPTLNDTIARHQDFLRFHFETGDGWCPEEYYESFRKDFPNARITVGNNNIEHAVVLDPEGTLFIARMVADWILV